MQDQLKIHTADGMELSFDIAGVGSRSWAFIIDLHLRMLLVLGWVIGATAIMNLYYSHPLWPGFFDIWDKQSGAALDAVLFPALAIWFFYHLVLEIVMHGRTPGKRMAGVRIIGSDGLTPASGALLIRNVFRLIDSMPMFYMLGLGVALFHPRHQRIGDLAAGTLLVHEQVPDSRDLEAVTAISNHSRLGPADIELTQELLARWGAFNRATRIDLAAALLTRLGVAPAADDKPARRVLALHRQLRELLGEGG